MDDGRELIASQKSCHLPWNVAANSLRSDTTSITISCAAGYTMFLKIVFCRDSPEKNVKMEAWKKYDGRLKKYVSDPRWIILLQ